jgi:hypothetical protein
MGLLVKKNTIIQASEYTPLPPVNPHLLGWTVKPKPEPMRVKKQVRANRKSTWAKEGFNTEAVYSGDLLKQMYEQTERDLAPQRFPDQEDFKQAERRMGKRMLHTDFIKRVLSLNKKLIYEDSKGVKDSGAFYLIENRPEGKSKIYTGACFRKGWIPEWTIIKTDAADLPTQDGLTYGWRTVLQRLVQKGAITYRQVVKVFGDVYRNDLCGKNWALNTNAFRN